MNKRKKKVKFVSTKGLFEKLGISAEEGTRYVRDFYKAMENEKDRIEMEEVLKKDKLTPEEIWRMKPSSFYAWRKKYDYPRILAHFSLKLTRFDDWKRQFEIDDEMLMQYGISQMIEAKSEKDKDRNKYILQQKWLGKTSTLLSFQNLEGKVSIMGGEPEIYSLLKKFVGYFDWCNEEKIKTEQRLLGLPHMSHYESTDIRITILDGLELLKVGGLEVPFERWGILHSKHFEFVNASYLTLKGHLSTQGIVLSFDNSFVDNLRCDDLDLALVEFSYSSVAKVNISNSVIRQWNFYKTSVSGKISNSELHNIRITGGSFSPILDNTFIDNVHAHHLDEVRFKSTYQSLKKTYAEQGDDKNAVHYFLMEKKIERIALRKSIFKHKTYSNFQLSWMKRALIWLRVTVTQIFLYVGGVLNTVYWGYGRKPFRIIGISLVAIVLFAVSYYYNQHLMRLPPGQTNMDFIDSLYYSAAAFTTLDAGGFSPYGSLRVITVCEGIFGVMSLSFLVAGFSNFKY